MAISCQSRFRKNANTILNFLRFRQESVFLTLGPIFQTPLYVILVTNTHLLCHPRLTSMFSNFKIKINVDEYFCQRRVGFVIFYRRKNVQKCLFIAK